jgi:hypothetical protein
VIGEALGSYRVLRQIGAGGMGMYLARHHPPLKEFLAFLRRGASGYLLKR